MICYKPSFPTPDQVGGDVKDTVYQITGIAFKDSLKCDSGSQAGMTRLGHYRYD
jgi:hypothetical protein